MTTEERVASNKLKEVGVRLRKIQQVDEYRVCVEGQDENSAYYTNDLEDALATGLDMAKRAKR